MKLNYENIWLRNGVFLLFISTVMYFQNSMIENENNFTIFKAIATNIILFAFIFFHNHFLVNNLLLKQKYWQYTIGIVTQLAILNLLVFKFGHFFGKPMRVPFVAQFVTLMMMHLIGVAFYFLHLSILQHIQKLQKKNLHSETEIVYLKQQLNPHFLLNALNNLYGVSLTNLADVPEKIVELSDLLKYQINTSKKEWIPLQEELTFIEQYIQYVKWKSNDLKINTTVTGQQQNFKILPMIFLPLLENAVKYSSQVQIPFIEMQWKFSNNKIEFEIKNNFDETKLNIQTTKTGIENLQKRLALYHPKSSLQLISNQNIFTAKLSIWNLPTVAY